MNEELKKFSEKCADDIEYATTSQEFSRDDRIEMGKALYNLGYRKIVWHKVADGDLPKKTSLYLCKMIYEETYNYEYKVLLFNTIYGFHDNGLSISNDTVIAWTELAKYEE